MADSDEDNGLSVADFSIIAAVQTFLLVLSIALAWILLRSFFPNEPTLVVAGVYGCTYKSVAMGVPLITAIYEGNPLVGLYTLPVLIYYPIQLFIGLLLAPRLYAWVQCEKERMGIDDRDSSRINNVMNIESGGNTLLNANAATQDPDTESAQQNPDDVEAIESDRASNMKHSDVSR